MRCHSVREQNKNFKSQFYIGKELEKILIQNSKGLFRQVTIERKEARLSCGKDILEVGVNPYKAQT